MKLFFLRPRKVVNTATKNCIVCRRSTVELQYMFLCKSSKTCIVQVTCFVHTLLRERCAACQGAKSHEDSALLHNIPCALVGRADLCGAGPNGLRTMSDNLLQYCAKVAAFRGLGMSPAFFYPTTADDKGALSTALMTIIGRTSSTTSPASSLVA